MEERVKARENGPQYSINTATNAAAAVPCRAAQARPRAGMPILRGGAEGADRLQNVTQRHLSFTLEREPRTLAM
jgi:hypothetical protein